MSLWGRLGTVFGDRENPLRWAVPLYRAHGIWVRAHVLFVVYIAAELVRSISREHFGLVHTGIAMAALFGLVLAHEYGHCIGSRWRGGEADEILLWPLGGLALCRPPFDWVSHLVTAAAGPMVNVALLPVLGGAVWAAAGDWRAAVFNPFNPGPAVSLMQGGDDLSTWMLYGLWVLHAINAAQLLFNVLLPMYPMDGGRLLQALLWWRLGHRASMDIAVLVGMVVAGVLMVLFLVTGEAVLMMVGLFGGVTCWMERRQMRFAASGGEDAAEESFRRAALERGRELAAARRAREEELRLRAEVDRILEKIKATGMQSLTKKERRTLDEARESSLGR